jgi:hypothetical protein
MTYRLSFEMVDSVGNLVLRTEKPTGVPEGYGVLYAYDYYVIPREDLKKIAEALNEHVE